MAPALPALPSLGSRSRVPVRPAGGGAPPRPLPLVVGGLALANAAGFALEVHLARVEGPEALDAFVGAWGLVPREFLRSVAQPGATAPSVWLTPLTAMFLHGGLLHVTSNLLALCAFGAGVERLLGHVRFLLFYLACGLAAVAAQLAGDPSAYTPSAGASGAIAGLLGAWAAALPSGRLRPVRPALQLCAALFLLLWIGIQLASGLVGAQGAGGVAWAHAGGFLAGAVLVRALWVSKPTPSALCT